MFHIANCTSIGSLFGCSCYQVWSSGPTWTWDSVYAFCMSFASYYGVASGRLAWFPTIAHWNALWPNIMSPLNSSGSVIFFGARSDASGNIWWSTDTTYDVPLNYAPTGISSITNGPNLCYYTLYPMTNFSADSCGITPPGMTSNYWTCEYPGN